MRTRSNVASRSLESRLLITKRGAAALFVLAAPAILNAQASSARAAQPIASTPGFVVSIGEDAAQLDGIAGVIRTRDGRFVIASVYGGTVAIVDSAGALVRLVGRNGSGPGEFRSIAWVGRCSPSEVFVFDRANARMSVVSPSGDVAREFALSGESSRALVPELLACSPTGRIAAQTFGREASEPRGAASSMRFHADVWVGSTETGALTRGGKSLSAEMFVLGGGGAPAPLGRKGVIAVAGNDIIVGAGERPALTILLSSGASRDITTGIPSARATAKSFEDAAEEILAMIPPEVVPRVRPTIMGLPRPDAFAPYESVLADECGRLWIVHRRAEAGGPGIRVLAPSGAVLGDVQLHDPVTVFEATSEYVVAARQDEDGVAKIFAYRVTLPPCR